MMGISNLLRIFLMLVFLAALGVGQAKAQEIQLDGATACGDMQCYPSLDDPKLFYYLPDQPRVATKDGKPQFSFLKYARAQEHTEAGTGRAGGGGIVHFLVTYGASKSRIAQAEAALQKNHPDAKIAGAVTYRKGSFALVTSFQENNERHTKTLAVGKAPLMEGQKTAVSLALTPEGAELLWESFKSATPDISLVFDMEFYGIREPYEATLEADWSQITKHDQISAGFKYAWFGADVDVLFQELRQTGAVKITTKGESKVLDKILQSANSKLLSIMFEASTNKELEKLRAEKKYDNLNEAMKLLKYNKKNAGLNLFNTDTYQYVSNYPKTDFLISSIFSNAYADTKSDLYNKARRLDEAARKAKWEKAATKKAIAAYLDYMQKAKPGGQREKEVNARLAYLEKKAGKDVAKSSDAGEDHPDASSPDTEKELDKALAKGIKKLSDQLGSDDESAASKPSAAKKTTPNKKAKPKSTKKSKSKAKPTARKDKSPGFSLVASYKMRRIKRSGKLVYQMNHMRSEKQSFVMTENIGDLYYRWGNDKRVFRAVTIDDPVFKQRDIAVSLDGQDIKSFTRYLNFVTVKLRKQHGGGHVTRDEVVITPELFSKSNNHFMLNYGWHDDSSRDSWLEYEYQAVWSFHGGKEINTGWLKGDDAMLALNPPHRYRAITFEADAKKLNDAGVRHAVITVDSNLQGQSVIETSTVKNIGEFPVAHLVVPQEGEKAPQVQVTWYLQGGKTLKGAAQILQGDIVYWDELPTGE